MLDAEASAGHEQASHDDEPEDDPESAGRPGRHVDRAELLAAVLGVPGVVVHLVFGDIVGRSVRRGRAVRFVMRLGRAVGGGQVFGVAHVAEGHLRPALWQTAGMSPSARALG